MPAKNELQCLDLRKVGEKVKSVKKLFGPEWIKRNRTQTLEKLNIKMSEKTAQLFLNIPDNYYYLGSHGWIDRSDPKQNISMRRAPSNVSIVFLSPVGMSISEKLDAKSRSFFNRASNLQKFHKNHLDFMKSSDIPNGLKKCIITH